jgi:hypothetical protein
MSRTINLTRSPRIEIPYINEEEAKLLNQNSEGYSKGKGWSLSYAYHFSEIRDVYLALKLKEFKNIEAFTNHCLSIDLPYVKTKWHKRRILEHINALKNFSLVGANNKIIQQVFNDSNIGDPLSQGDLRVFHEIYFSYFRFKEIFSWFIDINPDSRLNLVKRISKKEIEDNSLALYAFSNRGKLMDSFFNELEDNTPIYYIQYKVEDNKGNKITGGNEDLMRFWDVFVTWGKELKILEKFSLRDLAKTSSGRNIVCCYVMSNKDPRDFNLLEYVGKNYPRSYIHLPHLVLKMATEYRLSIEKTHELIIQQYEIHKEYFGFERTSEIFIRTAEIKEQDKILFPKYKGSYLSHLVVRR